MNASTGTETDKHGLGRDFWVYFGGQLVSTLGTSFSMFAFPLLVFKLTGSAVNLALTTASAMLPYLLFGLIIGAWVDRLDRKRLLIWTNVGQGIITASVPILAFSGHLTVEYLYASLFVASTLGIFFNSADFAAIPSLVGVDDLVTANGRIQASYSASMVIGPILAGLLISVTPIQSVFFVDAASFVIAAFSLLLVKRNFDAASDRKPSSIREDIVEGLRYVLGHPVLRNISIMMALVNFIATTVNTQLIFLAKTRLGATNTEIGFLFSGESVGVVLLSLAAGRLRKRWSFSRVALGALATEGVIIVVLAFVRSYVLAIPLVAAISGLAVLFNINTSSLRQAIVPSEMLGRVMSIATVLAWSAVPLGAIAGGFAIQETHNVALVYALIGILNIAIPLGFSMTALGRADRYISKPPAEETSEAIELANRTA